MGFAPSPVLPGESQAEFDLLLKDLRSELRPEGRLEDDAVQRIAAVTWRKQNLGIFARAQEARMRFRTFDYPGDQNGFLTIMGQLFEQAKTKTELLLKSAETLPEATTEKAGSEPQQTATTKESTSAQKTAKEPTKSDSDVPEIYTEIGTGLRVLKACEDLVQAGEEVFGPPSAESLANATNESALMMLAMKGELVTPERCIAELHLIAVLDETIERSYDWLMKIKREKEKSAKRDRVSRLIPDWAARQYDR
jgi:hypothetical protein